MPHSGGGATSSAALTLRHTLNLVPATCMTLQYVATILFIGDKRHLIDWWSLLPYTGCGKMFYGDTIARCIGIRYMLTRSWRSCDIVFQFQIYGHLNKNDMFLNNVRSYCGSCRFSLVHHKCQSRVVLSHVFVYSVNKCNPSRALIGSTDLQ